MDTTADSRIDQIIRNLDQFPIDDLIVASSEILWSLNAEAWKRFAMDQAAAGAYAWAKLSAYLVELRSIESRRQDLSIQIREALGQIDNAWAVGNLKQAGELKTRSWFLSGQQEVACHLFSICVTKILKYLEVAALPSRATIPRSDLDFLRTFTKARDHFEHPENRFPGKGKETALVDRTAGTFIVGLRTDDQGRPLFNDVPVEITQTGLLQVNAIASRAHNLIRESCLTNVRDFLSRHPEAVPDPSSVGLTLKWDIGRPGQ